MNCGGTLESEQPESELGSLIRRTADGFSRLVRQHLTLARLELLQDGRTVGGDLVRLAAFIPFVVVGLALVLAGIAMALSVWLGVAGGLVVVGFVSIGLGAGGLAWAFRRLRSRHLLADTIEEFGRSAQVLSDTMHEQ